MPKPTVETSLESVLVSAVGTPSAANENSLSRSTDFAWYRERNARRFAGYSLVGGVVFLLGIGTLAFLVSVMRVPAVLAGLVSTAMSLECNFFLNRSVNWSDRPGGVVRHWTRFHAARAGTVALSQLVYTAAVLLGVFYLAAIALTTTMLIAVNFVVSDRVVFR